jgi:two-component system chemotaxis response regulator CheY
MKYNYSKLKVLIADDSEFMRKLIRELIDILHISNVRVAPDAMAAWGILHEFNPDLIFTDWNMPPTSGLEFVRRVRSDKTVPNNFVPIIMVTGYREMTRVREARDAGVNELIIKPLTTSVLFDRIQSVVEDTRDFIRTDEFFGPDRRRGKRPPYQGVERRLGNVKAQLARSMQ